MGFGRGLGILAQTKSPPAPSPDEELERILEQARTQIIAIGCGGAGGNTITRLMEVGIQGAGTIALNTDAQDLLYTGADRKILVGRKITGGLGAGNDPEKGERCAREDIEMIRNGLQGADMVFVTCGLGGGTGTGAAPVVAEVAKGLGALTVGVVTLPFTVEGRYRRRNAERGLEKLRKVSDTLVIIPNDKLLEVVPDLPINDAFKLADKLLVDVIKGITELITKPGLINLDFADVRAVLQDGGIAMLGVGESRGDNRSEEAVQESLNSPLLDVDITGAKGALVHVIGGTDLKLKEAERAVAKVSEALDPNAQLIWGAQISEEMEGAMRVMVLLSGVRSPYAPTPSERPKKVEELDLGLDFL